MNRKQQSVVLAGMLAIALAGCSTFRGSSSDTAMGAGSSPASTSTASDSSGAAAGATGASGASGTSGSSMSGGNYGATTTEGAASTGASGSSGTSASDSSAQSQMPATGTGTAHAMPNATVALIESVPRAGATGSSGSSGSSASGSSGSSAGTGTADSRMYRITLRMDDGATRVVTQESVPGFRTGDRVNMAAGVISQ